MLRNVVALGLLASVAAFGVPSIVLRRPSAFLSARLRSATSSRARKVFVSPLCVDVKKDADGNDIVFDANSGWQADHNKAANAMAAGGHQQLKIKEQGTNQDTPDYFVAEDGKIVGSTDALNANLNANSVVEDAEKKDKGEGSGGANVLQELLSSNNAMTKEFDRQTYTTTLERMGGFTAHKWKVDGDWKTEPETFALKYNTVAGTGSVIFLQPNAMTYEDFLAGWTKDSAPGFSIKPDKGTMDRRGGEETPLTITYTGPQPSEEVYATLVVLLPNDNFQWTFKFQLSPP